MKLCNLGGDAPQPENRSKAGILQPATNVPFVPLEVQEQILDDDERRQEQQIQGAATEESTPSSSFEKMPPPPAPAAMMKVPGNSNPNVTIALPSKEAFEEMAHLVSTPYHGRRARDDDDDDIDFDNGNTCAVQIVSRSKPKPISPEPAAQDIEPEKVIEANKEESHEEPTQPEQQNFYNPLSPIMETSREVNYKSSSTSSGNSISHQLTKSHWGNTLGNNTTSGVSARTPGTTLGAMKTLPPVEELESASGYMVLETDWMKCE